MSNLFYKNLLLRKHTDHIEIELHLFENCNLRCAFCCQEHDDIGPTIPSLLKKLQLIEEFIKSKSTYTKFRVNLMGGELLQDSIPDYWIDFYGSYILRINKLLKNKDVEFSITTNLIFSKRERITKLIKYLRTKVKFNLNVSYDPTGRGWTNFQKANVYKPNIEYFKGYIQSISITLHRITIERLISKGDKYLDYLYGILDLNFDWYVPDKKLPYHFTPTDQQCKSVLIYLKDNYPDSTPIKDYLTREINPIQCCSENRILISADNTYSNCQYLEYKQKDFKTEIDPNSTTKLFKTFIKDQKCLSCSYFNRCGLYCYVAADFKGREKNEECFIKEFFKEL